MPRLKQMRPTQTQEVALDLAVPPVSPVRTRYRELLLCNPMNGIQRATGAYGFNAPNLWVKSHKLWVSRTDAIRPRETPLADCRRAITPPSNAEPPVVPSPEMISKCAWTRLRKCSSTTCRPRSGVAEIWHEDKLMVHSPGSQHGGGLC